MIILRIRQADLALRAGRLDEAFDLLRDDRVRAHRRGQGLVSRLVEQLVERATQHLADGRTTQAQADVEKAARLGGNLLPVAKLRGQIAQIALTKQRRHEQVAGAVAAAQRYVQRGDLSMGRQLLADIDNTGARVLMDQITTQRDRLTTALAGAEHALSDDDLARADTFVRQARAISPIDQRLTTLIAQLVTRWAVVAREAIADGRVAVAIEAHQHLAELEPNGSDAHDVERMLRELHQAWSTLAQSRPRDAIEHLRRVRLVLPRATWIDGTIDQLQAMDQILMDLRSGPLSVLADRVEAGAAPTRPPRPSHPSPAAPTPKPAPLLTPQRPKTGGDDMLPERFYLHVDGAGTFLVVTSSDVTIGPVSSPERPSVGLVTDPGTPIAHLERREDDYFLRSPPGVAVNGRPTTEKLLASGDRINLTQRCRFSFAVPNPASTTAILDLQGARFPRSDVTRILLLDRDLILGPTTAAHVRVGALADPVVLQLRSGRLHVTSRQTIAVDGAAIDPANPLPMGTTVTIGDVGIVISAA